MLIFQLCFTEGIYFAACERSGNVPGPQSSLGKSEYHIYDPCKLSAEPIARSLSLLSTRVGCPQSLTAAHGF